MHSIFYVFVLASNLVGAISGGPTPQASADRWVSQNQAQLKGRGSQLDLSEIRTTRDQRLDVFVYEQSFVHQGRKYPVEFGSLKIVVRKGVVNGISNPVVFANPKLADAPANLALGNVLISENQAKRIAQSQKDYSHLTNWNIRGRLLVSTGEGGDTGFPSALVWKISGTGTKITDEIQFPTVPSITAKTDLTPTKQFAAYSFYIDAVSGKLLQIQNDVHPMEAEGKVSAYATPGHNPDTLSNPPLLDLVQTLKVQAASPSTLLTEWTDENGFFSFSHPLNNFTTLGADLIGKWTQIIDAAGPLLQAQQNNFISGDFSHFIFNTAPNEFTTAQMNAFNWVTKTHDYIRKYAPNAFPGIDVELPTTVNIDSACNAYYYARTINFFRAKDYSTSIRCTNTAFAPIIVHEFGHNLVQNMNVGQNAFGEGYSDSLALLMLNDPVLGRGMYIDMAPVRDYTSTYVNYPCQGITHYCGMVLGGIWWEIRNQFVSKYGEPDGLENVRQLHMDWSLMTQGGAYFNAAHPQTAIEVLTADDDDGNLENGSPHFAEICAGFMSRGIRCPETKSYTAEIQINSRSQTELLRPNRDNQIKLNLSPIQGAVPPISADFWYQLNDGPWQIIPANAESPFQFSVSLPPMTCLDSVNYFFRAFKSLDHTETFWEKSLPYKAVVAGQKTLVASNDFSSPEDAAGWTASPSTVWSIRSRAADDYIWEDFEPNQSAWFSGSVVNDSFVPHNVTPITLTSPNYPTVDADGILISYVAANGPNPEYFGTNNQVVMFSRNNGQNWLNITNTNDSYDVLWLERSRIIKNLTPSSEPISVRVRHSSTYASLVSESGFDNLRISSLRCAESCMADMNQDDGVDIDDLLSFLTSFESGAVNADMNDDEAVDIDDLIEFLRAFENGC